MSAPNIHPPDGGDSLTLSAGRVVTPTPGYPLVRAAATRAGLTDQEIRNYVRAGTWKSVRRGGYQLAADSDLDPVSKHVTLVRATVPQIDDRSVVSHISAAAVHRLDLWSVDLTRVHVTRPEPAKGHRRPTLHVHRSRLPEPDIECVDGVTVTSPARTVVDLARTLTFQQAVVIADHALHLGLTAQELLDQVDQARGKWGHAKAKRVVAFADGLAEKLREDRLRDLGFEVVRWTWSDLRAFDGVAGRIRLAMERGRARGRG